MEELVAWEVDEVLDVLREVDGRVGEGLHAAGFVAYEAAPAMDPALTARDDSWLLPLACFQIYRRRLDGEPLAGLDLGEDSSRELDQLRPAIRQAEYEAGVGRIQELIAAGDSYQVNYTFPMQGGFSGSVKGLYAELCQAQSSAYCALLEGDGWAIVSASPELFFRRRGSEIELRPMKGTRPRGRWGVEDEQLAAELAASAKDRAENLMIVDLLRNDLGRIADWGTVEVPRLFEIERYPTVHQMTSTVRARIPETLPVSEIFRALFPSGSITGAPKVRTSEIIAELESGPRGVYTGAIGFVSPGEAVFSVAIRTLVLEQSGTVTLGVGSGITADSRPDEEFRECIAKSAFVDRRPNALRLLESLRLEIPGGYPLLDRHCRRMAASAEYFGYWLDLPTLRERLNAVAATLGSGTYKVRVTSGPKGDLEVQSEPLAVDDAPVRLALSRTPVDSSNRLLFHKTTDRSTYERARAEAGNVDEALLFNERGEVTETDRSTLLVRIDGRWLTPSLACGLLPGVARAVLLETGEVEEAVIRLDDLARAEAIDVTNSVRGRRAAKLI